MNEATIATTVSGAEPAAAKRPLGFWMCTALVIGNTIGMGIFLQPASLAPYGYNALIAWAITIFGTVLLALIFASLARRMAQADGPYEYVRATQGDGVAFLAMWSYWVSVWVTNAALAVGVVGYLTAVLPALGALPPVLVAVGLIWLFAIVNLLGVRTGGGVQIVTTVAQAHPDGSHHRARALDAARGSERLHAEPADDAGDDAVDSRGLGDRAVRNARHRIRRDSGGPGSRPGAHDPARYDRGYPDHGTGVRRA